MKFVHSESDSSANDDLDSSSEESEDLETLFLKNKRNRTVVKAEPMLMDDDLENENGDDDDDDDDDDDEYLDAAGRRKKLERKKKKERAERERLRKEKREKKAAEKLEREMKIALDGEDDNTEKRKRLKRSGHVKTEGNIEEVIPIFRKLKKKKNKNKNKKETLKEGMEIDVDVSDMKMSMEEMKVMEQKLAMEKGLSEGNWGEKPDLKGKEAKKDGEEDRTLLDDDLENENIVSHLNHIFKHTDYKKEKLKIVSNNNNKE